MDKVIRKWVRRAGARVLFALPTGQLASRTRAKHPDVDVDTCHAALRFHRELAEALPLLTQYDLAVIDEISMLTAAQFDRVVATWSAASGSCALCSSAISGSFRRQSGPPSPRTRAPHGGL